MSSVVDIQIVSTPNLTKIENFLNDSTYRDAIEYSANFNTRLCLERRLRLPFLDPQTGVAQNHCSLFMDRRQRMPGFREGQIYSYPAARWRKTRRQYLTKMLRPFGGITTIPAASTTGASSLLLSSSTLSSSSAAAGAAAAASVVAAVTSATSNNVASSKRSASAGTAGVEQSPVATLPTAVDPDSDFNGSALLDQESSSLGAADTSDSKDSQTMKEGDLPKEWFYDDMDINEIDALDEPKSPADDEYDYDPRYGNKKRKKRKPVRQAKNPQHHHQSHHHAGDGPRKGRPPGGGSGGGGSGGVGSGGSGSGSNRRGRRKNPNSSRTKPEPPSPTSIAEPPSFETAAAAVEHANIGEDSSSGDLRSYRKYL